MRSTLHELERLSPEIRLLRYHELSEDAFHTAAKTTDQKERADLIALGYGWRSLAMETEVTIRKLRDRYGP